MRAGPEASALRGNHAGVVTRAGTAGALLNGVEATGTRGGGQSRAAPWAAAASSQASEQERGPAVAISEAWRALGEAGAHQSGWWGTLLPSLGH